MKKITADSYDTALKWLIENTAGRSPEEIGKNHAQIAEITKKEMILYLASEVAKDDEHWRELRIKKAIEIGHPKLKWDKKAEMMIEYDLINEAILAHQRAEYCKMYPYVRPVYELLGWVVGTGKIEQPVEEPPAAKSSYADFLED